MVCGLVNTKIWRGGLGGLFAELRHPWNMISSDSIAGRVQESAGIVFVSTDFLHVLYNTRNQSFFAWKTLGFREMIFDIHSTSALYH